MKIDAMLLREDFYSILQSTVTEYYKAVYKKDISFGYIPFEHSEKLIVNAKLSFVSRKHVPSGLKTFLTGEYNIRGSAIKHALGKVMAALVCAMPDIGASSYAYITKEVLGSNTFISPQNRSIRFFDYDAMTVDCIVKSGFTDKYFNNQISFRKNNHYDFMLPMVSSGKGWFRERILIGHPLARVTDEATYNNSFHQALENISKIAQATLQTMPAAQYADFLAKKAAELLEQAKQLKKIAYADIVKKIVRNAVKAVRSSKADIPTVMSHGDFQGGNIWVDEKKKTWIYDWETVSRRSIWYDRAVLCCSLRRSTGWKKFLEDDDLKLVRGAFDCSVKPEIIKNVVLIEDVMFYLEDMLELPKDWGSDIFNRMMERLISALYGEKNDRS